MSFKSINPATEQIIQEYSGMSANEINSRIDEASMAVSSWKNLSFQERGSYILKMASILREDKSSLARIITEEMGKPISQSENEIEKCAGVLEYYAAQAEAMLQDEVAPSDASKSYIHYEPLGVVFAIMPWNFPMWQVYRCLAPTLMAGNALILKHAGNVSGCALAIEQVAVKSGLPLGVFKTLLASIDQIPSIISNPHVAAVTLTGSTRAGKAVASQAGEALKKVVLELGGSDPYIILEDADLAEAAKACATSRMINAGQSCVAAKRFIVVKAVMDKFEKLFVEAMKQYEMKSPMDREALMGPLARMDLRDQLHEQVMESVRAGAKLLLGGVVPDGVGAFYPATVLSNVTSGMPAYNDELFGPVASLIEACDESEAIRIANDSIYGLGAAIFTRDVCRGEKLAAESIEAGCCFVNTFVKSDPRLPFGGIKESGYGRELGTFGIHEFMNIKTIYVR